MNTLHKISIRHLDKDSILLEKPNGLTFYLPDEYKRFSYHNWAKNIEFREVFSELDLENNIYIVKKPVVIFDILNSFSITNSDYHDDESDISEINIVKLWEEVKSEFGKFDRYGKSELVKNILIKEHWHQCWEGDWDCNYEYIGVIDIDFNAKNILTKKSIMENEKQELEFKKYIEEV